MRAVVLALCLSIPLSGAAQTPESLSMPATDPATALTLWIDGFRPRAEAAGISHNTMEAAFADLSYLPIVVDRDRNQNEFTKTLWDYLSTAVSEARIRNGQARLTEFANLMAEIEARYRVDRHVVAAIWGLESAYGAVRGDIPTISALATLASDGRRGAFFESQLLGALTILQNGDVAAGDMRGSWAGAMGHTQFMPTSYLELAQDFRGDGRRDIWSDDPTDALASTAYYLQAAGWVEGQPWGIEVRLPEGFDYRLADRTVRMMPGSWAEIGVLDRTGAAVPNHGLASILLPAGAKGAAFMIFDNFAAIERYNTADSYVIAVGHLADRLRGGAPFETEWPRDDRALTFAERKELQERLTEAGFSTQGVDGLFGPNTIDAIRAWQLANGLTPDGYAPPSLLERLR